MTRPTPSRTARALVTALALIAFAGCSSGPSPAATPADLLVGDDCPDLVEGGTQAHFPDGHGASLSAVTLGTGRTGVVLSHMSDGDVCSWLAYARQLARAGYRAMVFYFHGYGTSGSGTGSSLDGDVVAAAKYLRGQGVQTIALVGASMGGTATVAAAAELTPAPAVAISLSAPEVFQGVDALAAAGKLTVPVLYAVGQGDVDFTDQTQALYDATPATTDRTILIAPTTAHGVGMVGAPGSQVRDAMDKVLRDHAPTAG